MAAVIQLRDGAAENIEGIRDFLAERLAGFEVPRLIEFATDLPARTRARSRAPAPCALLARRSRDLSCAAGGAVRNRCNYRRRRS